MKINWLGIEDNGTRSAEIRTNEISYRALLRCIHRIHGVNVIDKAHDPLNDNAKIIIKYKDITIHIETPFSDYIVNCSSSSEAFDEFVSYLEAYKVKWWERFL